MIQRFETMTGSEYEINRTLMTWKRISRTRLSGQIREESGILVMYPEIKVGEEAHLEDSKIQPGCFQHIIRTTPVMKVWDVAEPVNIEAKETEEKKWGLYVNDILIADSKHKFDADHSVVMLKKALGVE